MTINGFYAILSVLAVSLVAFSGLLLVYFKADKLRKWAYVLSSFAVGALLGNAFLHLLPEAYEQGHGTRQVGILVLAGILSMFVIEKLFHKHSSGVDVKTFGYVSLASDALHNFIDGLLIGAGWLISPEVGLAATIGIIVHEVPQEISDFGVLIHAGFSKRKALLVNFLTACTAIVGTLLALLLGTQVANFTYTLLPLAAGGFIYLAASGLIPELQKDHEVKKSVSQIFMIALGFSLIAWATAEHTHSHSLEQPTPTEQHDAHDCQELHDHQDHQGHNH